MKVYTSYYRKIADNPNGFILLRISVSKPKWFPYRTVECSELYPSWDLVQRLKTDKIIWDEYVQEYNMKLSALSKEELWKKLQALSAENDNRDIVLLCYENETKPCHRHLVAEWLGDVEEW